MEPTLTTTASPGTVAAPGREWFGMAAVGLASVALDFAVFNTLLVAGFGAWAANLVAIAVATLAAYWGNLRWTFAHRRVERPGRALALFVLVNLVSAGIVELGVIAVAAVTTEMAALNVAKFALTVAATVVRFWTYRTAVYR